MNNILLIKRKEVLYAISINSFSWMFFLQKEISLMTEQNTKIRSK